MNLASLASRRYHATQRINDAVTKLAPHDLEAEAEQLASIQEKNPQVHELMVLEALGAILNKVAKIKGGDVAGLERSYHVDAAEFEEFQRYRELKADQDDDASEIPAPASWTGTRMLDDGHLYQMAQDHPGKLLTIELMAHIGATHDVIMSADLDPREVRQLMEAVRRAAAEHAIESLEQGAPAPAEDQTPPTGEPIEPGKPGETLDDEIFDTAKRQALAEAGFATDEQIAAASDKELLAVKGIGDATLAKYRASGHPAPQEPPQGSNPPQEPPTTPDASQAPPAEAATLPEPPPPPAADTPPDSGSSTANEGAKEEPPPPTENAAPPSWPAPPEGQGS